MATNWKEKVHLRQGDITREAVDAIVNAANRRLAGGGGVDGAIHRAAGPELAQACRRIGHCETGQAVITPGFALPARYVIHTVGPVWKGPGDTAAPRLLASCYRESVRLAARHDLHSLAFPCISTGAYGYPFDDACRVALGALAEALEEHPTIQEVRLVVYSPSEFERYRRIYEEFDPRGD